MVHRYPPRPAPNDFPDLDLTKTRSDRTVLVQTAYGTYTVKKVPTPDDGFVITGMTYIEIDYDGMSDEGEFPKKASHATAGIHRGRPWHFNVPRDGIPVVAGTSAEVLKISFKED